MQLIMPPDLYVNFTKKIPLEPFMLEVPSSCFCCNRQYETPNHIYKKRTGSVYIDTIN